MATIQKRKSRGHTYWYIVESRRVNGKPRPITLAYLGKAEDLLARLTGKKSFDLKSYSHGDVSALLNMAIELDVVNIINKHVTTSKKSGKKPLRNDLTVGASLLLAAIGRVCHPTSKLGWYDWCKKTSLEYCLKSSFKKLDSRHFWEQMNSLPIESVALIEEEIVSKLIDKCEVKLDSLFYDTTNFFTFIDSTNNRCSLPRRGRNKQKRYDLRQVGLAFLVSRKDQFPLFHKTYQGNLNDFTVFKDVFDGMVNRLRKISEDLSDITIIFDKGNNSKENFKRIDNENDLYYVGGLTSSHFKNLIEEANENFEEVEINGKPVPVCRFKKKIWGAERTCVVSISSEFKEGQIRGIHQHLEKKYKELEDFKQQLENSKRRKNFKKDEIETRLKKIIRGQFIQEFLKYDFTSLEDGSLSFSYYIDNDIFERMQNEILGRRIHVTNRHDWEIEDIILAYQGQSKVEYAFRNLKNSSHMAVRPQFHWTDQKIEIHVLICVIGYLLAVTAYSKAKNLAGYQRNIDNFLNDLNEQRLSAIIEQKEGRKGRFKVDYSLEKTPPGLEKVLKVLGVTHSNLRPNLPVGVYKS